MFIIFGWGKRTLKNHGSVSKYHCDHCRNEESWNLCTSTTWFTLFFIPIIPYSVEHYLLCPVCSYGVNLDKSKFDNLLSSINISNKAINQPVGV